MIYVREDGIFTDDVIHLLEAQDLGFLQHLECHELARLLVLRQPYTSE